MTNISILNQHSTVKLKFLEYMLIVVGLVAFGKLSAQRQLCVKAGSSQSDFGSSITSDANGNLVFVGSSNGTLRFAELETNKPQNNFQRLILGSSTTEGVALFLKSIGGNGNVRGVDVVTEQGAIYAGGNFETSTIVGNDTLLSAGSQDILVIKTDIEGNTLWAIQAGGTGFDELHAISYLTGGGLFIAGSFEGTAFFGDTSLTSVGGKDVFVAHYNADGVCIGAIRTGGLGDDEALDILAHPELGIVFCGSFTGTGVFQSFSITSNGAKDFFIAKMESLLDWTLLSTGGSTGDDALLSIDYTPEHGMLLAGYFSETLFFANQAYMNQGGRDMLAVRLNEIGEISSVYTNGCDGDEWISSAKYSDDKIMLAGNYSSECVFENVEFQYVGEIDMFIMQLNQDWTTEEYKTFGGVSSDEMKKIAINSDGNCYATGSFIGNCSFSESSMSGRQSDAFIVSFNQAPINPDDVEISHFHTGNSGLTSNSIKHVHIDALNHVWISTLDSGVVRYDGQTWLSYNSTNSPLPNEVNQVFSGPAGLVWVSTPSNGVFRFDGNVWQQFTTQNSSLQSDSINSVTSFSEGSIWIGTKDLGCIRFIEPDDFTPFTAQNSAMPSNIILDMEHDTEGSYWIATQDGGVARFSGGEIESWNTGNSALSDNRINGLFVDKQDNTVFAATESGISVRENEQWSPLELGPELEGIAFNAVSRNRAGIVAAGSKTKGGHIRTPIVQRSMSTDNRLFDNQVVSIKNDTSNRIFWLASPDNGLFRVEFTGLITRNTTLENESAQIFPNPVHDVLNIRIQQEINESAILTITDMRGMKQKQEKITFQAGTHQVDVESLSSGIYYLQIQLSSKIVSFAFVKD